MPFAVGSLFSEVPSDQSNEENCLSNAKAV